MTGSRVLELGAGMSGLAGLGVAACSDAAEVIITDGNPDAFKNLEVCGCVSVWVCACSQKYGSLLDNVVYFSLFAGCPQVVVKELIG